MNATELAKLTGISKSAVNYYFSGERQVGFNTLIELCLALRLHPLRTEYLFELTHFELRRSDHRYYVIKEYLSGCAYKEKFNLHNYQMRLQKYNSLVSDEKKKVIDFEIYIYGTKDAEEQKHDFFGKALKRYANDIGVNATELAKLTGISKSAVNYYFSSERQVGFNTLIALCLALRLHPLRTEYLFELTHFELRKSDPRYYIIKEYLSGRAYKEKFNLHNYQIRLQKYNFLVSDEREEVTDFEIYIYGTKNAEEQKHDFLGKALKRYADDNGVSMSKLARLTEVSKVAVNYYFSGERQVGFHTLIALCLALRLHPLRTEYFF